MKSDTSFTLVLSGGGLKGLAHIGVLRALEERGLRPSLVVGSSMGSMIAAAWASGMSVDEMTVRALEVRRRDVFQVAHVDMALRRMKAPAVYRPEPLERLIDSLVGNRTFLELHRTLLVNTVDLNSGMQVLWGLPGLRDVRVADAVFASCALPGIFPPKQIGERFYVDGAVTANLPVRIAAAVGRGPLIAVNVAATSVYRADVETQGFAAIYIRGLEIVMQVQIANQLRNWDGPPVLLIEPEVEQISMFAFHQTAELIRKGYTATAEALDLYDGQLDRIEKGIHPRRNVVVRVNQRRCVGCGLCIARAPDVFERDPSGTARVIAPNQVWSPLDGSYVRECPTHAIEVTEVPIVRKLSGEPPAAHSMAE